MNNTGFINGYRWGVEYPTNGSKPDLPDDVIIQLSTSMCRGALSVFAGSAMHAAKGASFKIIDERYKPEDTSYLGEYFAVQGIDQQKIKNTLISDVAAVAKGRIINSPEALAQFDSDLAEHMKNKSESEWFDYTNQKALRLPPVGEKVEVLMHWTGGWSVGWVLVVGHDADGVIWRNGSDTKSYIHSPRCEIRPLNWNRKAEAERKRVVDAAQKECVNFSSNDLGRLYDAGFLRMPEDK
jgi:hypothetical protein